MRNYRVSSNWIWIAILAVQPVLIAVLFIGYVKSDVTPERGSVLVALDILCIIIAMLFYLSILRSGNKKGDSLFLLLIFVSEFYLFLDGNWYFIEGVPSFHTIHVMDNVLYLMCSIGITLIYWNFLDTWVGRSEKLYKKANIVMNLTASIHTLLIILSPLTGWYFSILPDGNYIRGPLYVLTIALPFIMVMICIMRILYHNMSLAERIILLTYLIPPMVAAIVQAKFPGVTILSVATFIFIALLYTNYYVRKEAEIAELEHDLTRSDLKTLQMQIKPHFLYNTLHSIAGLCDLDVKAAQEMIYRLASYMRDNFTDIDRPSMVSFKEELTQLDHYLSIESMRFSNITIKKDIEASDFMIPAFTLQPLVENSIKHGISKRSKTAGTIRIASSETEDAWVASVIDDGIGFDAKNLQEPAGDHYGLENVKRRLNILCDGNLKISSTPGHGTTVQITIPKKFKMGG